MGKGNKSKSYASGHFETLNFTCICGREFSFHNQRLCQRVVRAHRKVCQVSLATRENKVNLRLRDSYILREKTIEAHSRNEKDNVGIDCIITGKNDINILEVADRLAKMYDKYTPGGIIQDAVVDSDKFIKEKIEKRRRKRRNRRKMKSAGKMGGENVLNIHTYHHTYKKT